MQITTETLDCLREIGEMGDSYEDVIKKLLDERAICIEDGNNIDHSLIVAFADNRVHVQPDGTILIDPERAIESKKEE